MDELPAFLAREVGSGWLAALHPLFETICYVTEGMPPGITLHGDEPVVTLD